MMLGWLAVAGRAFLGTKNGDGVDQCMPCVRFLSLYSRAPTTLPLSPAHLSLYLSPPHSLTHSLFLSLSLSLSLYIQAPQETQLLSWHVSLRMLKSPRVSH